MSGVEGTAADGASRRPRIDPVVIADCSDEVRKSLEASTAVTGGAVNVFTTLARHEGLFKRYMAFAAKLFGRGNLGVVDRELIILRTAHLCESPYEWAQHIRIGLDVGLTEEAIAAIAVGSTDPSWNERDRVVLEATESIVSTHTIDDDTWAQLSAHLDEVQMIELTLLAGNYVMLAGFLNAARVQVES